MLPYTITYTNYFKVDNKIFAFRKKELFNISTTPKHLPIKSNNGSNGYWINREWYSLSRIKQLIINEPLKVDVSNLQWNEQAELDEVFNLIKNPLN